MLCVYMIAFRNQFQFRIYPSSCKLNAFVKGSVLQSNWSKNESMNNEFVPKFINLKEMKLHIKSVTWLHLATEGSINFCYIFSHDRYRFFEWRSLCTQNDIDIHSTLQFHWILGYTTYLSIRKRNLCSHKKW